MKNLYWVIIAIVLIILLAKEYALYKIPQAHYIKGQLTYNQESSIEPGTLFKLSLESRPKGENEFTILSASEQNVFAMFPQSFTLPVLKKSLSATGLYQLRVQIIKDDKLLYVNRELLPLTRHDLTKALSIEMQSAPQEKLEVQVKVQPESQPKLTVQPVEEIITIVKETEPVKLDIPALLANKTWVLNSKVKNKPHLTFDIQKGRVFGSGGCNNFQGGYQIEQTLLIFNHFISSAKHCATGMKVEDYFLDSVAKVKEWAVKDNHLYLYDKDKLLLLEFLADK